MGATRQFSKIFSLSSMIYLFIILSNIYLRCESGIIYDIADIDKRVERVEHHNRRAHDKLKKFSIAESLEQKKIRHANDAFGKISQSDSERDPKDVIINFTVHDEDKIFSPRFRRTVDNQNRNRASQKDQLKHKVKKGVADKPIKRSKRSLEDAVEIESDHTAKLLYDAPHIEVQNFKMENHRTIGDVPIRRLDIAIDEDKESKSIVHKGEQISLISSEQDKTRKNIEKEQMGDEKDIDLKNIQHADASNSNKKEQNSESLAKTRTSVSSLQTENSDVSLNKKSNKIEENSSKNSKNPLTGEKRSLEIPQTQIVDTRKIIGNKKTVQSLGKTRTDSKQKPKTVLNSINSEHSRHFRLAKIHQFRTQALEIQQRLRDLSFLQKLRDQIGDIIPGIPRFSENQLLTTLKSIILAKNIEVDPKNDVDLSRVSTLNNNQIDIIKCAQQLVPIRERQSFTENIVECISGLNVFNCLRIFVYPILVESVPESLVQSFPTLPIEINVADLIQGNRNRQSRQFTKHAFIASPKKLSQETILYSILHKNSPVLGGFKSQFDRKKFSDSLSCDQAKVLKAMEKFLPEEARQTYMAHMELCLSRFNFISCVKNVAWPFVKEFSPAIPEYPFPEPFVMITPLNPFYPYPAGLTNNMPLMADFSRLNERNPTMPETLILNFFKKSFNTYPNINPPSIPFIAPIQLNVNAKVPIKLDKLETSLGELLPLTGRQDISQDTNLCLQQFDYNTCILNKILPFFKQYNQQLPTLPQLQQVFQLPNFPEFLQFLQQVPQNAFDGFTNFFGINQKPMTPSNAQNRSKAEWEIYEFKIIEILKNVTAVRNLTTPPGFSLIDNKLIELPFMNLRKIYILQLAESLVPQSDKEFLKAKILFCFNENDTETCSRTVIWPYLSNYIPEGLPALPAFQNNEKPSPQTSKEKETQENATENLEKVDIEKSPTIDITVPDPATLIESRSKAKEDHLKKSDTTKSKVPTIHVTGTNYYPTLVENPENIIYNIINSIPSSNSDTPKIIAPIIASNFSEFPERQAEIIQMTGHLLPNEVRRDFFSDMYNCLQNFNFLVCSRDIVWPTLLHYFPNLPPFPILVNLLITKNTTYTNSTESINGNQIPVETNVDTLKYGESTVTISDTKFVPLFPAHPESVIFNILKSVQIYSNVTQDAFNDSLVNSFDFEKSFSLRQRHILQLAEGLAINQSRSEFLHAVYDCNKNDTFLNCSRNEIFTRLKEIYPEFPQFPNFDKELNGPISSSEIEQFLQQAKSRQFEQNDLGFGKLKFPALDNLYVSLSEDKKLMLRALVNNLPDSIYYDLFVKMNQCLQYSNEVNCANDIMYPTLKQYYDVPGFNLDEYYPTTQESAITSSEKVSPTKQATVNYEIYCDEMSIMCTLITKTPIQLIQAQQPTEVQYYKSQMPYIPFGKSEDGRQIYKQVEELWQSNLPSSVADGNIDNSRIPEFSGQPTASLVDLSDEKVSLLHQSTENFEKSEPVNNQKNIKRVRRNVVDLFNSYSHKIPHKNKSSVSRRLSAKPDNITETEILQYLISLSKLKKENMPDKGNERQSDKSYLVDQLTETEKNSLSGDQYEILKLIEDLSPQSARASIMRQVFQCIRSLSLIRCVGIFVWPMIAENILPQFPFPSIPFLPFSSDQRQVYHNSRSFEKFHESFGLSANELQQELMDRKNLIEGNLINWYKTLSDSKYNINLGPLKFKGNGQREIQITMSEYREGRNTNLQEEKSIIKMIDTINKYIVNILDTRSDKFNRMKKTRNSRHSKIDDSRKFLKDEEVINLLIEKIRKTDHFKAENIDEHKITLDDAYNAFQLLFGPKYELDFQDIDQGELNMIPLETQNNKKRPKNKSTSSTDRIMNSRSLNSMKNGDPRDRKYSFKNLLADYFEKCFYSSRKKLQTGLVVRLPRLEDAISSKKMTSALAVGRGMKDKLQAAAPAIGLILSFIIQMSLSHAKAASTVAEMLSNMALAGATLSMLRDMVFGMTSDQPKIKYSYDNNEKFDTGMTWPMIHDDIEPGINSMIHKPY